MKFIELPRQLKVQIRPVYLLKGDDDFVIASAIKHISNACGNEMNDFNKSTFDNETFYTNKFIESVNLLPLGNDKRFVLVKAITKINEADKKQLALVLENIPETTCVAIVYTDAWKFLKSAELVDCGKMDFDMLSKYVTIELRKTNKQISNDAMRTFIDLCSYNMTKISTELKKITAYSDEPIIEKSDVTTLVSADVEYQIFELTECLGNKNGEKALRILSSFLQKKEPVQNLFSLILNHFRRIAHISISGMAPADLAAILGVKEYAIIKAKEQSKLFSKVQLKNILNLLEEVDSSIKNGKMTAENAIYYLVFKILYC